MTDFLDPNSADAVGFKAPKDAETKTIANELPFGQIKAEVAGYKGDGFESVEKVEDVGLVEYLQRLKADHGRYLGNIVHQGVRDHYGMSEHSGGLGVYEKELERIVESGALISTVLKDLQSEGKLKIAVDEIRQHVITGLSLEDAVEKYLHSEFEAGRYDYQGVVDQVAIHVSSNYIIDAYYGAETGNESCVVFPEQVALKNRIFYGRAIASSDVETKYNDVYLWPKQEEENRLDINGALLFLPRDNPVDKETGSLYDVKNGRAVLDYEKMDKLSVDTEAIQLNKNLNWFLYRCDYLKIKDQILSEIGEQDRTFLADLLKKLLETERVSEIGMAFMAILDPVQFKKEFLSVEEDRMRGFGVDVERLRKILDNDSTRLAVKDFFERYSDLYNGLANSGKGLFYKTAEQPVLSKNYYDNFIRQRLDGVQMTTVKSDKQDIVEYRGVNKQGQKEVLRVVYYSAHDPNEAIYEFYDDFEVDFDRTILGEGGKGSTSFTEVDYRYDYNRLRQKLIEMAQTSK